MKTLHLMIRLPLDITQVHMSHASGRRKLGMLDFANVIKRKQSVIQIKNKDELCCTWALVTAQARHKNLANKLARETCLKVASKGEGPSMTLWFARNFSIPKGVTRVSDCRGLSQSWKRYNF